MKSIEQSDFEIVKQVLSGKEGSAVFIYIIKCTPTKKNYNEHASRKSSNFHLKYPFPYYIGLTEDLYGRVRDHFFSGNTTLPRNYKKELIYISKCTKILHISL